MYEDDGLTKDALKKQLYELLHFEAGTLKDLLMFSLEREKHRSYSGMPLHRNIELIVHGFGHKPNVILVDEDVIPFTSTLSGYKSTEQTKAYWDEASKKLSFRFTWKKDELGIAIQ